MVRMNGENYANSWGPESPMWSPPSQEVSGTAGSCRAETRVNTGSNPHNFPVVVSKSMTKSHVSGGFWLGLPAGLCDNHLGSVTTETTIVLEDEEGKLWDTKYLPNGKGLSGGWRRFALDHDLQVGNTLEFQFISINRCKVAIFRGKDPKIADSESLIDRDDSWKCKIPTNTVTGIQSRLKERQRDGDTKPNRLKKRKSMSETNIEKRYMGEATGARCQDPRERLWERKSTTKIREPSNTCSLRREESHHSDGILESNEESDELGRRLQGLVEKKHSIPTSYTGGQRSSREENDDSDDCGMIDLRHPGETHAKEKARALQKKIQVQGSTPRRLNEMKPSKNMCSTFDTDVKDATSDEEHEDDENFHLRPRNGHNHAAAAEGFRRKEIDDSSCKLDGRKVTGGKSERYNLWSRADQHQQGDDPHITVGRNEILHYKERCKAAAAAAPQEGNEETLNKESTLPSSKEETANDNVLSEDPDDAAAGEERDDMSLPVSAGEFARDISLLRVWFKRQVVQVAEDLKTTILSSSESQQRDTQKRVQLQSNQQREFFDHLVQRQHEVLDSILDHKIESQIQQLRLRFDHRLNNMIEELKDFIQASLNAGPGLDRRRKYY